MSEKYPHVEEAFYRVSVKCLIENDAGEFLLSLEDGGFWDIPGGGIDHGETPHEAIGREILEEMGLVVTSISDEPIIFCVTQSTGNNGPINPLALAVYKVTVENLDFTPSSECREIGFFNEESIQNIEPYPGVIKILEQLKKRKA